MSSSPALPTAPVITGLPAFFAALGFMPKPVASLKMSGPSMIILNVDKDGSVKVRRSGETIVTLPPGTQILAVPVEVGTPNVYFVEGNNEPKCKSNDGIVGIGDIGEGVGTRQCSGCQKFQWGTDPKGGKGKACKTTIMLGLSLAAVMKFDSSGREAVQIDSEHHWWTSIATEKMEGDGPWWLSDYKHPDPVVLRITNSSFKAWDKAISDIERLHKEWPLGGTCWSIKTSTTIIGGNKVGLWDFAVAPLAEATRWQGELAASLRSHPTIANIAAAADEKQGITEPINDEQA